jgi:hypothetical protein
MQRLTYGELRARLGLLPRRLGPARLDDRGDDGMRALWGELGIRVDPQPVPPVGVERFEN